MADNCQKKRSANFSTADCLLLAEVMGRDSGTEGLTFHAYTKHRFTNKITASSKKVMWEKINSQFNEQAEVPRDTINVNKKWDNLIQIHKSLYSDFTFNMNKTGGGSNSKLLSELTEAVMNVIGRRSNSVVGVAGNELDSTMLLINAMSESNTSTSNGSSTSQSGSLNNGVVGIELAPYCRNALEDISVVCCKCQCHKNIEKLKEEKLKLQIRALKRKLDEE